MPNQCKKTHPVVPIERELSSKQQEHDHANGPYVRLDAVSCLKEHFWCNVGESADGQSHDLVWNNNTTQAKVCNFHVAWPIRSYVRDKQQARARLRSSHTRQRGTFLIRPTVSTRTAKNIFGLDVTMDDAHSMKVPKRALDGDSRSARDTKSKEHSPHVARTVQLQTTVEQHESILAP